MIIGLDVGGTNIDAVIIKDGSIIKKVKMPINFSEVFNSIWNSITKLLENINYEEITKINLSTTISTNAIILNEVNEVGMFIQTGPGLGFEHLIKNDNIVFLSGYTDHRGVIVKKINEAEVKAGIKKFKQKGLKDISVITKFSTRNNETELKIKELIKNDFENITLGHLMSGNLNFPRRINTSYLNAAVKPTFSEFAKHIKNAFRQIGINLPINILKADGGIISLSAATNKPVETVLSGPSASLMGLLALTNINEDAILLDIGGTTTDIFFLKNGTPLFAAKGIEINKYKTLVRAIFSQSVPLGGNSILSVVNQKIIIGPKSANLALALGGIDLTVTDVLIYLDKLNMGNKSLISIKINDLAQKCQLNEIEFSNLVIKTFTNKIHEAANNILNEINNKPVYTINEILNTNKIVPNKLVVVGGPAAALKDNLFASFKIETIIPSNYEVANAIGAALAKTTAGLSLIANTETKRVNVSELGLQMEISANFNLKKAKIMADELLKRHLIELGSEETQTEILEASSFSMIDGFYTKGENIRVKIQVKPGLISKLKEGVNHE